MIMVVILRRIVSETMVFLGKIRCVCVLMTVLGKYVKQIQVLLKEPALMPNVLDIVLLSILAVEVELLNYV